MSEGELGRLYSDGEIIFKEGERGEAMFVIQTGRVRITKKSGGDEMTIAELDSGEIFGEMSLFDKLPRSATASAFGGARILSVDKKKLFSTISRDPTLVFKILESMSRRIRKLNEEFMNLRKNKNSSLQLYLDVDTTCRLVLEEAKNIISAECGSVMLLDESKETLSIRAAFGPEREPKVRLLVGEGIAGDVVRTGRAELVNNVSLDSRFITGESHIKSMLCAPLKWQENIVGVINMSNTSEHLFTLEELKLLRSLAIYASIAIQNAMNFSALEKTTDEILMHASIMDVW